MEDINQAIVNNIKNRIISKSEKVPFSQTKLGVFLNTDWLAIFSDKLYIRSQRKKQKESEMDIIYVAKESEYIPNRDNINDEPQMVEIDENKNRYYTYPNNIVDIRKPKYIFSSIFPSEEIQNEVMDYLNYLDEIELDNRKKKLFSKYLGISEEEIVLMTWDEIDEAILNKYIKTHLWKKRTLLEGKNVR